MSYIIDNYDTARVAEAVICTCGRSWKLSDDNGDDPSTFAIIDMLQRMFSRPQIAGIHIPAFQISVK